VPKRKRSAEQLVEGRAAGQHWRSGELRSTCHLEN